MKYIFYLFCLISFYSCDLISKDSEREFIKDIREQGGFIETENDRELKKELLSGLKPKTLDSYPEELKLKIDSYVADKYPEKSDNYSFTVYHTTVIEYSPDTVGYLDTNTYMVDLNLFNDYDTNLVTLNYSKSFNLIFDYER